QDAIAADKKRVQSGDFKDEKAVSSFAKKSSKSVKHVDGFHRIPADCVIDISQCLIFPEVAALACCTTVTKGLCSLKLKGPPSLALSRRQVLSSHPQLNFKLKAPAGALSSTQSKDLLRVRPHCMIAPLNKTV